MTTAHPPIFRIQLLGGFSIRSGEVVIPPEQFRLRKARSLLKLLALAPEHRLHRDQVIEWLWPDTDPVSAGKSLNQAIYAVRTVLKALGLAARQTLSFNGEFLHLCPEASLWVDVTAFEYALAKARASQDPADFQAALDLYTGDLLPEDPYEEWAIPRREFLRRECLKLQLALVGLLETRREFPDATSHLQQALAIDPACEEAHAGLMRLLALAGQRSAALTQYEACRHALEKELGVEPSSQTTHLYEQIRDKALTPSTSSPQPANLPTFLIPFVGRRSLLAATRQRLLDPACRLLTLVGPGGCGKTRLAVEAISTLAGDFPDGIYYVPLVSLQSLDGLIPAIAQDIGFYFYDKEDPKRQLLDYLRGKTMLLLLDNFEHLIAASAHQGEAGSQTLIDLLEAAPHVKVLVTSRTRLDLLSETLLPIPGMRTPSDPVETVAGALQFSAVRLFLEGARRVTPNFVPDEQNLDDILSICRRVEGMPLAILLAAGWMRLLSPAEINEQIATHSLDFLASHNRDLPERQRSLRAVFEHSWRLMDERERVIFAAISVFRGGFTADAAQKVCDASLADLAGLADQSLLNRSAAGRFELHELLRQYAQEQLNDSSDRSLVVRDRHAGYFIDLLFAISEKQKRSERNSHQQQFFLESANFEAAWAWAVQCHRADLLRAGLEGLCTLLGDQYRWQEAVLAFHQAYESVILSEDQRPTEMLVLKADLLATEANFNLSLDRNDLAMQQYHQALELLDEAEHGGQDVRFLRAGILHAIAMPLQGPDGTVNSAEILESCLKIYRQLGFRYGEAHVLSSLGDLNQAQGNFEKAICLWQESLGIFQEIGPQSSSEYHWIQINLVFAALQCGLSHHTDIEKQLEENIAFLRGRNQKVGWLTGIYVQAVYRHFQGQFALMIPPLQEYLEIAQNLGNQGFTARAWMRLGVAHIGLGQYEQAQQALEKSLAIYQEGGHRWGIGIVNCHLGELALIAGQAERAQKFLLKGLTDLRFVGNIGLVAQELPMLAITQLALNDTQAARQTLSEALILSGRYRNFPAQANTLASAALFAASTAKLEQAVELSALAAGIPFLANSAGFQTLVCARVEPLALDLPLEVAAAAQERGRRRDLWETIRSLQAHPEFTQGVNQKLIQN